MSELNGAARQVRRRPNEDTHEGSVRASAYVCEAASCMSLQAHDITLRLAQATADAGMTDVVVKRVGCMGLCAAGPLVQIPETGELFSAVKPDDVEPIVQALDKVTDAPVRLPLGPFFEHQVRVVTENFGEIDPESLDDYVARGGYESLQRVLSEMTSTQVREEITKSGLRGRGGAGYPTGLKWTTVAKAAGTQKYVICNADEGDPGAFMDRSVLESDPFRVLEGMAIAAFAVHANEGYIYCRAEYPLAVARLRGAIRQAQKAGFLGQGIADTSFNFDIQIRLGAGAFVCGEETALIAVGRGQARHTAAPPAVPRRRGPARLPHADQQRRELRQRAGNPAQGQRVVLEPRRGQEQGHQGVRARRAHREHGPRRGPDGHVAARDRVRHRRRHHRRPAVQGRADRRPLRRLHSGPVPRHADDATRRSSRSARSWARVGSSSWTTRRAWWTSPSTSWTSAATSRAASACPAGWAPPRCGCCSTRSRAAGLTSIDLAQLERLAGVVQRMSLCGLGQGAPNPIFSTLRYFRDEYMAHIVDRRCPAGVCEIEQTAEVPA